LADKVKTAHTSVM